MSASGRPRYRVVTAPEVPAYCSVEGADVRAAAVIGPDGLFYIHRPSDAIDAHTLDGFQMGPVVLDSAVQPDAITGGNSGPAIGGPTTKVVVAAAEVAGSDTPERLAAIVAPALARKMARPAPVGKTAGGTPAKKTTGRAPVKKTTGRAPVKKTTGRAPVKKTTGRAPAKKTTGRTPAKKTTGRTPAKKTAGRAPATRATKRSRGR